MIQGLTPEVGEGVRVAAAPSPCGEVVWAVRNRKLSLVAGLLLEAASRLDAFDGECDRLVDGMLADARFLCERSGRNAQ